MLVFSNPFSFKSVFKKFRFLDGLVWTVGLTIAKNPAFSNSSSFKSASKRLRFRVGIVWTVGLTVEIKLRFHIPPV